MADFKDFINGGLSSIKPNISVGFGKNGLSLSANFNQRLQSIQQQSNLNSPLKDLYSTANAGDEGLVRTFPADLDITKYMRIRLVERVKEKYKSNGQTRTKETYILPLPNNLNPEYSVNYRDEPMGVLGAMAAGQVTLGDVESGYADVKQQATNAWERFKRDFDTGTVSEGTKAAGAAVGISAATTLLGASLAGLAGGAVAGAIGGVPQVFDGVFSQAGKAPNSHLTVLFDGVGFRNFSFQYRFIPKNAAEAETLRLMLNSLRTAMYPSLPAENKFLFNYPDEFLIDFCSAIDDNLFPIQRCVMTNMNVNYNGDGVPRFFEDGKPVVIDVTMNFREVEIVTKETFYNDKIFTSSQADAVLNGSEFENFQDESINPLEYAP